MQLFICPGEGYVPPQNPGGGNTGGGTGNAGSGTGNTGSGNMSGGTGSMGGNMGGTGNAGGSNETESEREDSILRLNEDMRLAWLNHVYWTRMYLMSAVADNADQQAVEERLLETADEITDVFARYLPIATTRQLRNLLTEHIEIAGQIIQALKAKNMSDYDALVKEWYRNANQMAALFANYNPYFESRETRNMLLNHLDLTREEIEHQVNGEYEQSIDVFRGRRAAGTCVGGLLCERTAGKIKTYRLKPSAKCNSTDHSFVKADRTAAEKAPCGRVRLQTAWWNSRDAQGIFGGLEKCQK